MENHLKTLKTDMHSGFVLRITEFYNSNNVSKVILKNNGSAEFHVPYKDCRMILPIKKKKLLHGKR